MTRVVLALLCALAGCQPAEERDDEASVGDSRLEQAAVAAGVIPDAGSVRLSGSFVRRSELGEDRFCAVGSDERGYQVGMLAVFGPNSRCEGLGEATRDGERISIRLDSKDDCRFDARFDGVEINVPGNLPDACESYCTPRARFDGVSFGRVGEGDAVARSTRGNDFDYLCPDI